MRMMFVASMVVMFGVCCWLVPRLGGSLNIIAFKMWMELWLRVGVTVNWLGIGLMVIRLGVGVLVRVWGCNWWMY